jgi:hypothetical protein
MHSRWFLAGAVVGFILLLFKMKKAGIISCCGASKSAPSMLAGTYSAAPLQSQCYVQPPSQFVQ